VRQPCNELVSRLRSSDKDKIGCNIDLFDSDMLHSKENELVLACGRAVVVNMPHRYAYSTSHREFYTSPSHDGNELGSKN
jgi:hypothetical protein